jgi:hypothetical protein
LKHCSSCGREIPESATLCQECEQWAVDSEAGIVPDAAPQHATAPSSGAPAPSFRAGVGRRGLLVILSAVGVAGLVAFTMLSAGGPSPEVTAAPVEAPARKASPRPSPPSPPPVAAVTRTWSSENRAEWVGKQRNAAAFELAANNTVDIWLSRVRPLLIVRCVSKRTEVFVWTGSALKMEAQGDDHTVTFEVDDEPELTERWPDSAEHDALFAPDGAAFATLRFGYTPHNAAAVMAEFQVSGLGELVEPVAKECGWKK